MRRLLFTAAILGAAAATGSAQFDKVTSKDDGNYESGWVVQIPAASSDYFNTRYDNAPNASGIHVDIADFGSTSGFPFVAVTGAQLGVDPSGNTPDLTATVGDVFTGVGGGIDGPINSQFTSSSSVALPSTAHVVVQFPPGDPGTIGVSADTDTRERGGNEPPGSGGNPPDGSFFTLDGYSTPAAGPFTAGDFALGLLEDVGDGNSHLSINAGGEFGEWDQYTVGAGDGIGFSAYAPNRPGFATLWALFISFLGAPLFIIGPVLPALPYDSDGDGSPDWNALKLASSWPLGAGNLTINFVIVSGSPGLVGSIQVSNEVTINSLGDPPVTPWGINDDGSYETGWVVQIPSQSSDYFSSKYDSSTVAQNWSVLQLAAMDFGGSVSSYPSAGLADPNLGLDPGGLSPDFTSVYGSGAFAFPSLTFVTTSGQLVSNGYGPATIAAGTDTVAWIQFPPFDPGLIGVGGDTSPAGVGSHGGWTLDGFSTPANAWGLGEWGYRAQ